MKLLFIGDIVGSSGRRVVVDHLSLLKKEHNIDFTIANGENAAHGKGITRKIYDQFKSLGIDAITMGNHTFAKHEIYEDYKYCPDLLVPGNMEPLNFGRYYKVFDVQGKRICVVNLYGEAFMYRAAGSPFSFMDDVLDEVDADFYFIDLHAESTSEKRFFFQYYRGQIQACVGTHTHIQTADETVVDGCAYITDVGMCGVEDSIIGRDYHELYDTIIDGKKTHFKPAQGSAILQAVVIEIDDDSMQSTNIQRIQIREGE